MSDNQQHKPIDALSDWSKWLLGIDFLAGTGCVTVLQIGVKSDLRASLILAIIAFAIAIACAVVLVRCLAHLAGYITAGAEDGNAPSIYDYRLWKGAFWLSYLQLAFTCVGMAGLLWWVCLKPSPPPEGKDTQILQTAPELETHREEAVEPALANAEASRQPQPGENAAANQQRIEFNGQTFFYVIPADALARDTGRPAADIPEASERPFDSPDAGLSAPATSGDPLDGFPN